MDAEEIGLLLKMYPDDKHTMVNGRAEHLQALHDAFPSICKQLERLEKELELVRSSKESITEDVLTLTKELERLREREAKWQAFGEAVEAMDGGRGSDEEKTFSVFMDAGWKYQRDAALKLKP